MTKINQTSDLEQPEEPKPLERALFRETDDGRLIYFPWGLTKQGYRLPDESAKTPAIRALSLLVGAVLAIAAWTASALQPLIESDRWSTDILGVLVWPIVALAAALFGYYLWTWRYVEHFPETSFRVERDEQLREAAALVGPWKLVVIGAVTIVLSGLVIWIESGAVWLGIVGVIAGLGILWWSVVLRRARRRHEENTSQ